jgi:hypothetical protein
LKVHHEDLKHALRLAGPNNTAQETWHASFEMPAGRAPQSFAAFPELDFVDGHVKDFITGIRRPAGRQAQALQQCLRRSRWLFASACNQYRASMNEVAAWASSGARWSTAGSAFGTRRLLRAYLEGRLRETRRLQRRDGYTGQLNQRQTPRYLLPWADHELLREIPCSRFSPQDELGQLARTVREITLGPMERIIVEGGRTSLFVVVKARARWSGSATASTR